MCANKSAGMDCCLILNAMMAIMKMETVAHRSAKFKLILGVSTVVLQQNQTVSMPPIILLSYFSIKFTGCRVVMQVFLYLS